MEGQRRHRLHRAADDLTVNGKQYIAIASGIGGVARAKLARSPEMKTLSNATVLFVFGL